MVEIHVPLQPPENPQIPAGPGSSPQTRRHPRSWPRTPGGQNPPAPLLRLRSGGVRGLYLEFGGPVLGFSGPARGPRRGCARGARSFHSRTLGARGHSERRTWGAATLGFRPWRTGRAGFPARGRGAPGRADPRGGCSRGRVGDSCARSIPAPARAPSPPPRRAAPSRPHRSRAAPPAALSANTANVCAGHRGWASAAGAGGVPGAPRPRPPLPPPQLGLRGPEEFEGPSGGNSTPPHTPPVLLRGGWSRPVWGRLAGRPDCGASACSALPAPQFPPLESDTQRLGDPRAPEVACAPLAPSARFSLLPAPTVRCGSGSRAAGWSPGRRGCKYGEARMEALPEGVGDTNAPPSLRPGPLLSRLCGDHLPFPPLRVCPAVCSRGN